MDSGLKKRLLGAAVLIALAVIFVPMLLPGGTSPEPGGGSVSIPPEPEAAFKTQTLKVGPDSASAGSTAAALSDPDRVATLDLDKGAAAVQSTAAAAAASVAETTTPPASAGPESAQGAASASASAPSTTEPQPLPGGAGAAAGTVYAVNLGIYADHAGARKLVADAKRHGFTAVATPESFRGKPVLRVRVGPFSSKARAEAARLKLKAFTSVPMTVEAATIDQPGDVASSALPAGQPGAWAVQLAAFSDQASARKLRDRLRSQGFDGYVDSVKTSGGTLWRVRAGPFATRASAETARTRIAGQLKMKGNIVTQD